MRLVLYSTGLLQKHPDKNYDVDGVMSELVSYKLKPDDPSNRYGVSSPPLGANIIAEYNVFYYPAACGGVVYFSANANSWRYN